MEIKVRLYTILKDYGKNRIGDDDSMNITENTTLKGLALHLNIPEKLGKVYLVNGAHRDRDYILQEGDNVKIFSFFGGG